MKTKYETQFSIKPMSMVEIEKKSIKKIDQKTNNSG
jgi:hypothetical protein